jgi:uncharacterized membrane protein YhaH (DUF805 family)
MNRTKFWTRYLAVLGLMIVANVIMKATDSLAVAPLDAMILASGMLALAGMQIYLVYLRACDVGYTRPGWMTAAVFIPVVGLFVLLTIGCLPTGSRPAGKHMPQIDFRGRRVWAAQPAE